MLGNNQSLLGQGLKQSDLSWPCSKCEWIREYHRSRPTWFCHT